jgi:hypothetical protein
MRILEIRYEERKNRVFPIKHGPQKFAYYPGNSSPCSSSGCWIRKQKEKLKLSL